MGKTQIGLFQIDSFSRQLGQPARFFQRSGNFEQIAFMPRQIIFHAQMQRTRRNHFTSLPGNQHDRNIQLALLAQQPDKLQTIHTSGQTVIHQHYIEICSLIRIDRQQRQCILCTRHRRQMQMRCMLSQMMAHQIDIGTAMSDIQYS